MSRASEAARQLLWDAGYDSAQEVEDLTELVFGLGLLYRETPLKGCDAMIVYSPSGKTAQVTVNSEMRYEPRKRFSIAHELGHFVLGHNKLHCDNAGTLDCYRSGHQEAEANEFASELLMPASAFMEAVRGKCFCPRLMQEVAEMFGTSVSSVVYRYVTCGPHPVACVYSYKGKVVWMRKNREMRRYMTDWKDLTVPQNSVSEEFFQDPRDFNYGLDEIDKVKVDLNVWFQEPKSKQRCSHDSWRVQHALGGNRGWDSYEDLDDDPGGGECYEYCFTSPFGGCLAVIWED